MRLLRAIVILVAAAVAACTSCSGDSGSGSESNFLCTTDADCPRGACVNKICDPDAVPASSMLDASDATEPPDEASSSGGTGGGTGGTSGAGGAPDAGGAGAGGDGDAATSPDSGTDASPVLSCGSGPTALYLMVDRSITMVDLVGSSSTSIWDATTSGIISFLQSPLSTGLDAAIQYFPLPDPCNPATYATPDVPFGALPGNETAITTSISDNDPAIQPVVGKAVSESLQSAISYSKTSASSSGDEVAVVLITNGYPSSPCNAAMAEVARIAQDGFTTAPAVRTYVIGIREMPLWQYDQVTMAGGTGPAFLISTPNPGELTAAVTDALVRIVGRACEPCTVPIDCAGGGVCALGYCVSPG